MGANSSQFDQGFIGKDIQKLVLRFVAIIVVSPLIGWMMARAWVPGNVIYMSVADGMKQILGTDNLSQALQLVASAGMGLYFGFLTIFILDIKKRVQGALLLLGTAIGLVVLTLQGVLLPNLDPGYTPNILAFFVLYVGGLVLDIDKLLSIDPSESTLRDPRTSNGDIPEFSNAAKGLFVVIALIIVLSLVQVILAGAFEVFDVVAAVVGIYLLYSFIQYEVKSDYMLLGPGQSGKSMAMLGMALTMYDFDDVQPDPNTYLQGAIDVAGDPQYEDWPFDQTEGLQETSFQMLVGDLFPRRMRLVAFDYPGQLLSEVSARVRELSSSSPLDVVPFVGETESPVPEVKADGGNITNQGDIVEIIANNVVEADTLMIVIDCERLVHPQSFEGETGTADERDRSLGIEFYEPILANTDVENTIITATKADVLIHDDSLPVEPPGEAGGFDVFKRQVNDMLDQRVAIKELKQQLGQSDIHPVFYKTKKEDGEYVPIHDDYHNLIPVGYEQLVDTIRRAH